MGPEILKYNGQGNRVFINGNGRSRPEREPVRHTLSLRWRHDAELEMVPWQ